MPEFICPPEAAGRSHVCQQTIRNWCVRHRIGAKIGGRWRIDPAALDRLLAGGKAAASSIEGAVS
jgi:Helix-turn-helix domain